MRLIPTSSPARAARTAVALIARFPRRRRPGLAAARRRRQLGAWRDKGRIVVSDTEFRRLRVGRRDGAAMKKQAKTTIKGDDNWTMNLMVFLKEPAGANSINIVYYDVSVKPREQVNFSEVSVKPDQRIVQLNGVAISKDLGFVKGHKYEVLATRIIGGKEKVYAKDHGHVEVAGCARRGGRAGCRGVCRRASSACIGGATVRGQPRTPRSPPGTRRAPSTSACATWWGA